MTAIEAWKKTEKRLIQLDWLLDSELKIWKKASLLVDFADKTEIQMITANDNQFKISLKELALITSWIETYWIVNYK